MEAKSTRNSFRERAYVMKKHHATRLHYDLRLEWNGVLLSWALPAGPSCHAGVPREAIEMKDHRLVNLLFEGVHETGPIMRWDCGTWEPHVESNDIERSLHSGILRFTLRGERLKGGWTLARTNTSSNTSNPIWTLCKHADEFAESCPGRCILKEQPNSLTEKTVEEIVEDWTAPRKKHDRQMRLFSQ